MIIILILVHIIIIHRFFMIFILSKRNEVILREEGAKEYGKSGTIILSVSIALCYMSSVIEVIITQPDFNTISIIGLAFFIFSAVSLYLIIHSLGKYYTVKIFITPNQRLNNNFIFKFLKHPIYFLNLIPEFLAIFIISQSWVSFFIFFPLFLISLVIRILQEEKALKLLRSY